ncbi:MAG: hypothetical protein ACD_82C00150G0001 [uncultured bacterium]|nr:MAG: hypothetical protein ACD_82C00150G0001 [uncultured bacterium]KKP29379.1 MAG: hypothetical protein UR12_C0008G0006 [candidate division TM6 bacterium GW2011_GWF2_30_66]
MINRKSLFIKPILSVLVVLSFPIQANFLYESAQKKIVDLTDRLTDRVEEAREDIKDKILDSSLIIKAGLFGLMGASAIGFFHYGAKIMNPISLILGSNKSIFSVFKKFGICAAGLSVFAYAQYLMFNMKQRQLINPKFIIEEQIVVPAERVPLEEHPVVEGQEKECPFCLDDKNPEDFHIMSCCGFECCKNCLLRNGAPIDEAIKTRDIGKLICQNPACTDRKQGLQMRDEDLNAIASEQDLIEIGKLRRNKENEDRFSRLPEFRRCKTPDCKACYVIPKDNYGAKLNGDIKCPSCRKVYCADCGYRHLSGETCEKALKRIIKIMSGAEKNKLDEQWIKDNTRKCPGCGVNIDRTEGCRAMHCTRCNKEFCWNCLQIVGDHTHGHKCPKAPKGEEKNIFAIN